MLCGDRAVPIWGKPEDGNASDKTLKTTLLSEIAHLLAHHGVESGADIYIAAAALVTEANLSALSDPLFISRLPATYAACERVLQEAVAPQAWEEGGVLAQTKPTQNRPAASYKAFESEVALDGKPYRAVVVQSSAQEKRRQQRLTRESQASSPTLQAAMRAAEKQAYFCRAAAEVAAAKLRAMQTDSHRVDGTVEERPKYGQGRPSPRKPREVKAMRDGLKPVLTACADRIATKREEAGCFVLLTNVPKEGAFAHGTGDVLKAYKEPHGVAQNVGFLKAPVSVHSLFLKKPERIEALGLVLLLALLLWRVMERSLRAHVDTTGTPLVGGDKKVTARPTAFMMGTKFSGVIVLKVGRQRQLAHPLSAVQQQYLTAWGLPATCFTMPNRG
jgi:transposase